MSALKMEGRARQCNSLSILYFSSIPRFYTCIETNTLSLSYPNSTSLTRPQTLTQPFNPRPATTTPQPKQKMDNLFPRATTNNDNDTAVSNFRFYYYQPSLAAAILFTTLFTLTTTTHIYQLLRSRTYFLIPFIIGGVFESVGYIGRIIAAEEAPGPYQLAPYIMQSVLLLVAPALFAASIYMELGRIVVMIQGDGALFIRRTWLTKIFVVGDVVSFFIQAGGAGLLSSGDAEKIDVGRDIIIVGLVLQVAFFGLFVIAAAIFHFRIWRHPTPLVAERPWKKHMLGLYIVSVLIFVRSIVRVVEYVQGYDGYIMTHEVFLYVFDGLVMLAAVVSMNVIHPGEVARYVRQMREGDEKVKEASSGGESGNSA